MKKNSLFSSILRLTPFVFSFALGLDIYIPIIPQMAEIFETTPSFVQLTLSLFLLMTGAGQLVMGPLSDQIGRKACFYLSTALFTIGSLGSALSPTILFLIVARILCGIGACGMLVTAFALVRDLYSKEESAKMYSFLNGAIGISPTFAPVLGGYLYLFFGWQSVFFFLVGIGSLAFFVSRFCIKETLDLNKRTKLGLGVFKRYFEIVKNEQFLCYALIAGLAEAIFFCFFSISPFVITEIHGVPIHQFGYYFALFGAVVSLGGFLSGLLIEKYGIVKTLYIGIFLMLAGGLFMFAFSTFMPYMLSGFLFSMVFACTGAIFLIGGSASKALEPFEKIAGTASAAFGAIEFAIPSIVGSILMLFPITPIPYALVIVSVSTLSFCLLRYEEKDATNSNYSSCSLSKE